MALNKSTLFDPTLVGDLINKVQGESSLAKMSRQIPIAFNGNKEFTFTMDKEIDVVAESGAKSHGGVTVSPVTIIPIKVEYGARVSDEFMYAAEEEQINILKAFNDGFARKVARGMDLMAFHGVNPRTGLDSTVIGNNNFDTAVAQTVAYNVASPDADGNIESAVAQIRAAGYGVNGLIMSPTFSSALSTTLASANGPRKYPELAWGANPQTINGLSTDINKTVSDMTNDTGRAILGDFANAFKWGYAKTIPLEIIQYGNPDNDANAGDLKGHNQVYLRCELYLGWGILDGTAFSRIVAEAPAGGLTLTLSKATDLSGGTKVAVAPDLGANNEYLLKKNGTIPRVNTVVVDTEDGWADYTENAEIAAIVGETIAVVEVVAASGKVVKGGTKVVATANLKS